MRKTVYCETIRSTGDREIHMKRAAALSVLTIAVLLLVLSGTALASPPFLQVHGRGVVGTWTFSANDPPSYWSVTGTAKIAVNAKSVGDPTIYNLGHTDEYAVCAAEGSVKITVDDPGLHRTFHGKVIELTTYYPTYNALDILFVDGADTYRLSVADYPSGDEVFLYFLMDFLADESGSHYLWSPVISGNFHVVDPIY